MAQRVLITGINGFIGRNLAHALVSAGFDVLGSSLESGPKDLPSSVEYHAVDVTDYAAIDALLARTRFDALIHLAALVHVRDAQLSFSDYARVNYRASEHLFERAAHHRVKRILFASTVEVYGPPTNGEVVDEKRPCRPESDYARAKLLAEESLHRVCVEHVEHVVPFAILRFAPVYGDQFRLNLDKRLYLKRPWLGYRVGKGGYRLHLCSIRNIEHFVTTWLRLPRPPPSGIFNLADPASHSVRDLHETERHHGNARVVLPLPLWPCLAALSLREVAYSLLDRDVGMYTSANFRKLGNSVTWKIAKAEHAVGTLPGDLEHDLYAP